MADALERRSGEILRENEQDVAPGQARAHAAPRRRPAVPRRGPHGRDGRRRARGGRAARPGRRRSTAAGRMANGLRVIRMRVPLGVIAVVYEGRPNVTADAAALCLESGNAVILRGSRTARRSNRILAEVMAGALIEAGPPRWRRGAARGRPATSCVRCSSMERRGRPGDPARGRGAQRTFIEEHARVPVIYAASGQQPRLRRRRRRPRRWRSRSPSTPRSSARACATRPRPCWCTATPRAEFLPPRGARAAGAGRGAPRVDRAGLGMLGERRRGRGRGDRGRLRARSSSRWSWPCGWWTPSTTAVDHIDRHGSGHSEAIVTASLAAARRVPGRGRRRVRLRQRLDPVHRRRRVRHGRRDRQLDAEAPRARARSGSPS